MSLGDDRIVCSKFRNYLMNRCGLAYSTAGCYIWTINSLSKALQDAGVIDGSIYDIKNIHYLLDLKTKLATSDLFKITNNDCGGRLTSGLRHYYDFMVSSSSSDHSRDNHTRVSYQRG